MHRDSMDVLSHHERSVPCVHFFASFVGFVVKRLLQQQGESLVASPARVRRTPAFQS